MIRRPPRSTPLYSSAASDVYKRQDRGGQDQTLRLPAFLSRTGPGRALHPSGPLLPLLESLRLRAVDPFHQLGGRDQPPHALLGGEQGGGSPEPGRQEPQRSARAGAGTCLLYTSDAADE